MKRASNFIFLLILLIILSTTGCSTEYQSERYLYRATRLAKNILINPEAIPPQEFDRAVKAYQNIFETYPDTWSARRARISIGSLYLSKNEHGKAREVFEEVLELYPDNKKICLEAQFAIGKSYEKEGMWGKALLEYNKLIADYPNTEIGFSLPMYIAAKHNSYSRAILHYKKISEENPKTILGFRAENFIVMGYLKERNWYEAAESLERLVMDYPMAKSIGLNMRMIADISVKRLDDPERAIKIFERFLEKHPQHPLKDYLTKGLEALNNVHATEE